MSLAPSDTTGAPGDAVAAGRGARRPGAPARTGRRPRPGPSGRRRVLTRGSVPYLLIMPAVLGFAVFKAYPIAASFWISLTTGNGDSERFAGLANYRRLIGDPLFWTALENTGLILVVQVPLMLGLALLVALGLNSTRVRLRPLWRLGVFIPSLTGLVAAGVMFSV
ncbi:carbohydrate ABC transporter permease, partial [Streptomyces hydrogenans]